MTGVLTQTKTKFLSDALERIQRSFCNILFPHKSYEWSLENLQLQNLHERRIRLARRTASKMSKNDKLKNLFIEANKLNTRSSKKFKEPSWKSIRYGYSAIPFFIRLLNGEEPKVQ